MSPSNTPDPHPDLPMANDLSSPSAGNSSPPPPRHSGNPAPAAPRRGGGVLGWLLAFLLLGIVAVEALVIFAQFAAYRDYFDTSHGIQEKYVSGDESASDKVALITVSGVIYTPDFVKKQIDRVRGDDGVKAVVLRVDSPGGTVTGADYIYHHLVKLKQDLAEEGRDLKLVVSMGGIAASGGYYVAMAVEDERDTIFAEPTTTTGSIGVIIPHYDLSGLLKEWNIENDSITNDAGRFKQLLSMTQSMDPEEEGISEEEAKRRRQAREILKEYVNQSFERFLDIVKKGRPNMSPVEIDAAANGRIFTAQQALERGLVDRIGFVEDAVDRAIALAGLDKDDTRVVRYQSPPSLLSVLGAEVPQRPAVGLDTLLDMTTPRAYYLATWAAPSATNN